MLNILWINLELIIYVLLIY